MLTNYFTLRQLVREWSLVLPGLEVVDAWSQERGELTVAFSSPPDSKAEPEPWSPALKISVQAPLRYVFLNPNTARARKNVAPRFAGLEGEHVRKIDMPLNDRPVELHLESGRTLRMELFGPRANVYLLDADRTVIDRFRSEGRSMGEYIERSQSISLPRSPDALAQALLASKGPPARRLQRAFPILDGDTARGVVEGVAAAVAGRFDAAAGALFDAVLKMTERLEVPEPRIYWRGERADRFALLPVADMEGTREEIFATVSEAVRIFARRKLAQRSFDEVFLPIERTIVTRLEKARKSRERMAAEMKSGSRADTYERYGHILMALQTSVPSGVEAMTLDDVISGSGRVSIPLKKNLSAVQNAERYYERARESRKRRLHSGQRLADLDARIDRLESLLAEVRKADTVADVEKFRRNHREILASLSSQKSGLQSEVPFRRFDLGGGYEVWVGRSAAQNDLLTLRYARKHDLWMHARGVPGSHVILRRPGRDENPPAAVVERAASIAAFFSKGATSALVPVVVTERRYVRKPSKSPPGTVIVEREEVMMVRPELPSS